ncbi:MAG: ABC transporter substrate-binding protein [Clostridiales bacterium]|nr:ABC transporter substrate-binding protein [Clostridiales bacterium]
MRRMLAMVLSVMLGIATIAGCGAKENKAVGNENPKGTVSNDANVETIGIAYQYGLAYAPLIIVKEQGLIEQAYEAATGKQIKVTWNQMSSGPDINTAFVSGTIHIGFMGVAPAITGISNEVGYKIFTNLSGQEHGLMTSDTSVNTLGDLVGSDKQIALVNIGSIQHIILGRALDYAGYDAHALDSNIVAMKHPDGMNALMSGGVPCQLTTNPYLFRERQDGNLHEVKGISDVWSVEDSFIVGVASKNLYENNPELYNAVCDAIADAIAYVNENPKEAAKLTCEYNGNSAEDELEYMMAGNYSTETKGIFELSAFMADAGFIENRFESYSDFVFENVRGD